MSQTYKFSMEMMCDGCAGSANKVLNKLNTEDNPDAVSDKKITWQDKTVIVTTTLPKEKIEETLKKTGKEVQFVETL